MLSCWGAEHLPDLGESITFRSKISLEHAHRTIHNLLATIEELSFAGLLLLAHSALKPALCRTVVLSRLCMLSTISGATPAAFDWAAAASLLCDLRM